MKDAIQLQIERLLELKQLYESGILTKEEMEVEKKKILGPNRAPIKKILEEENPMPLKTQQNQTNNVKESENGKEESFFKRHKYAIIICITLFLITIASIIFSQTSHSYSDTNNKEEIVHKDIFLKGVIGNNIGFSMRLKQSGDEIKGKEHYDSQKSDAIINIRGTTIGNEGIIFLNEYDGNFKAGTFEGKITNNILSGTFTNSQEKICRFLQDC